MCFNWAAVVFCLLLMWVLLLISEYLCISVHSLWLCLLELSWCYPCQWLVMRLSIYTLEVTGCNGWMVPLFIVSTRNVYLLCRRMVWYEIKFSIYMAFIFEVGGWRKETKLPTLWPSTKWSKGATTLYWGWILAFSSWPQVDQASFKCRRPYLGGVLRLRMLYLKIVSETRSFIKIIGQFGKFTMFI